MAKKFRDLEMVRLSIAFLVHNIFGVGGTNRAVLNLAQQLSLNHDVEIVSVFRRVAEPIWRIDPHISLRALVDTRPGQTDRIDPRQWQRSSIVPAGEEFYNTYSRLTDDRLQEQFANSGHDVYVGTRPALNLAIATWGPTRAARVAQEHQTHMSLDDSVRDAMRASYSSLDAVVTVTRADALAFAQNTMVLGPRLLTIPNSVPAPALAPAELKNHLIMAAGRLDSVKRYDVLLRAFDVVRRVAPDWQLRIFGGGKEAEALRRLIADLGLTNHALLMGRNSDLTGEWHKASIAVSTSDRESFGMSLVEAMRSGVPCVSTRAPDGPEEIITHNVDGLLVPVADVDAVADGLLRLVQAPPVRASLGGNAVAAAMRFDPAEVSKSYERLFAELRPGRRPSTVTERLTRPLAQQVRKAISSLRIQPAEDAQQATATVTMLDASVVVQIADSFRAPEAVSMIVTERGGDCVFHVYAEDAKGGGDCMMTVPLEFFQREGVWNAHLAAGSLQPALRVRFGTADTHSQVTADVTHPGPFRRVLPYRTRDGYLAFRSWVRPDHAECDALRVVDDQLVFEGRSLWATQGAGVRDVIAARRQGPAVSVRGRVISSKRNAFKISLSVDELARQRLTHHDVWDIYLKSTNGDVARLSKLADDIVERKPVWVYPAMHCRDMIDSIQADEHPPPRIWARPYLTLDSDVSVAVTDR